MDRFVDREGELERLRDAYDSAEPELVVVYGRRRMGKSTLVGTSIADRDGAVHYQATEMTRRRQLEDFAETAARTYPGIDRLELEWETLLEYLAERDAIVVLDEFPYLVAADESIPSVIQRLWDHEWPDRATTLVLIGSSISMMVDAVLDGGSPLFGRWTAKFELGPMDVAAVRAFVPSADPTELVTAYGVFGGTPHYLEKVDPDRSLATNVAELVLSPDGLLHDEPDHVLRMELSEPRRYFSVLDAMAAGNRERNEIAQAAGIEANQAGYYLDRLERLDLIRRDVPVTVAQKDRSRRGRYRIRDPFFRFWFRFVFGNEGRYDRVGASWYDDVVAPALPDVVSPAFEALCRDALPRLYDDVGFLDVGKWWYREREVDVVGLGTDGVLVAGECKFTADPVGHDVLSRLERDADEIRWTPDGGDRRHEYALFSRSGFAESLERAAADREDLRLFGVADVVATDT